MFETRRRQYSGDVVLYICRILESGEDVGVLGVYFCCAQSGSGGVFRERISVVPFRGAPRPYRCWAKLAEVRLYSFSCYRRPIKGSQDCIWSEGPHSPADRCCIPVCASVFCACVCVCVCVCEIMSGYRPRIQEYLRTARGFWSVPPSAIHNLVAMAIRYV